MFLFVLLVKHSSTTKQESTVQHLEKYHHYADVLEKVKANTLPHHRPYDCPIDLQMEKEPPLGTNLQFVTNQARSPWSLYRGEFGKWFHLTFEISNQRAHFLPQEKRWINLSRRRLPSLE